MGMTAHSGEMPQEYSRGVSRWEPTRGSGRDRFRMRLVPSADATMSPAHRGSDVHVGAVTGRLEQAYARGLPKSTPLDVDRSLEFPSPGKQGFARRIIVL